MSLPLCDTVILSGPSCPGHLGKFGDCLTEALYGWGLDGGDEQAGDTDFEGHVTLIIVPEDSAATVGPDEPRPRVVRVPAGNYLLWEASSGGVTLTSTDTEDEAREVFGVYDARYALWSNGCDPNRPDDHEGCADYVGCLIPAWVDA